MFRMHRSLSQRPLPICASHLIHVPIFACIRSSYVAKLYLLEEVLVLGNILEAGIS